MPYIGRSTDGFGVRNRFLYLASADDTSVSGADANGATLTFTDGAYVDVYLNGVLLKAGTDYNTNTANTIASLSAMSANDEVTVIVYDVFTVADTVSAKDGGTFSGNVTFGSGIEGGVVFNDDSADVDFRVEGNGDANALFVEGETDNVGIGNNDPADKLHVYLASGQRIARFEANNSTSAHIAFKASNTSLMPTIGVKDEDLYFSTGDAVERARFDADSNGDLVLATGDIVFSTSGKGINLGVTSNTDANTLDDYEEGTFTPAADSFSGTMTFTTANYVKIGKLVHVNFKMTSDGNSDTSQISISGFPFSAVQEHPVSMSHDMAGNGALQSNTTPTIPNGMINTAEILYVYLPTGGAFQYAFMGTGFIRVSGTYITT